MNKHFSSSRKTVKVITVFELTDFNKKHKSLSFKPVNFACILKFTKPQLQDKSFKDGVIDQLYELFLETFHAYAHTIAFPELALPAVLQLKEFVKKCKVGNFTKQMKQILDKVEENSTFITSRRRSANLNLSDRKSIDRWEDSCLEASTPLNKFYKTWRKFRDRELMHRIADRDEVVETDLPEIKRPKGPLKATDTEKKEFSALFDSDSDDNDMDLTESFLPPDEKKELMKERKKKGKDKEGKDAKKATKDKSKATKDDSDDDDDDLYEDFDSDELEQLAGSGSDGDDGEVEYDDGKEDDDDDDDVNDDDDDDGENADEDDDEDDDDDDVPEGEDIVKEFTMSSDEDLD
ncbi:nucleolar complex protein 2 homolog [Ruditapes philippinarum]|uniref:nucleolar complex protein 2 homolog n=1 Tax=Ruditapes philippinarum TaxID=129788 RepID=UPI00295B7951|nr:nucleolar complex protein 2 homolog [Ruditapes philippinarum]